MSAEAPPPDGGGPREPFRLRSGFGAALVGLALLLFGVGVLATSATARRFDLGPGTTFPILLVASAALVWGLLVATRRPLRQFGPSFAVVAGTQMLVLLAAFSFLFLAVGDSCGPTVGAVAWSQPGLYPLAVGAGAALQPPRHGLAGPWEQATVVGIAYHGGAADGQSGRPGGFYLRTDYQGDAVLTHGGPWDDATSQRLRELAANLTSDDPARWEGPLRGGQPFALRNLDRLPGLLSDLANRSQPVPSGGLGRGSLESGPWRVDLSGAVATLDRLRADALGGAWFATGRTGTLPEAEAAAQAWLAQRGWPFQPEGLRGHASIC